MKSNYIILGLIIIVLAMLSIINPPMRPIVKGTTVKQMGQLGTGSFISNDGYIVTNRHVVLDHKTNKLLHNAIFIYNGHAYPLLLIGYSKTSDVALLKILPGVNNEMPAINCNPVDGREVKLGEIIYPLMFDYSHHDYSHVNTQRANYYSAVVVDIRLWILSTLSFEIKPPIVYNGNSGSPVVDASNHVIGLAFAGYEDSKGRNYNSFIVYSTGIVKLFKTTNTYPQCNKPTKTPTLAVGSVFAWDNK